MTISNNAWAHSEEFVPTLAHTRLFRIRHRYNSLRTEPSPGPKRSEKNTRSSPRSGETATREPSESERKPRKVLCAQSDGARREYLGGAAIYISWQDSRDGAPVA